MDIDKATISARGMAGKANGAHVKTRDSMTAAGFLIDVPEYDISIILTSHNEARYLKRTLASLEEATRYVRQFDVTVEIVVVLDCGDAATSKLVSEYDYGVFDSYQVIKSSNGAPGLSRNDGIDACLGNYVVTLDADDLVAFDFLQRMYFAAFSSPSRTVVFPEFCFGFGEMSYIYKIFGRSIIKNSAIFDSHPYVARILFPKYLFNRIRNVDVSVRNGYAHEDWHFNSQCLANGFSVTIANGAIFFYRERNGSMRRLFENNTPGLIPPSPYYEPATYLKLTWGDFVGDKEDVPAPQFTVNEFLDLPGVPDVVHRVNQIEPYISLGILRYRHAFTNFKDPSLAARIYFDVCRMVAGHEFTDILIVPFFVKGGAEKYIQSILDVICASDPSFRLLVISTHEHLRHDWIDRFPKNSIYVDLHYLAGLGGAKLTMQMAEEVTLRLIQHVPGVKRLYFKNCEFVDSFLRRFSRYISHLDTTFFHFSDPRVEFDGYFFTNGQSFDLVGEMGQKLTRIVSDNESCLRALADRVGEENLAPLEVLYNVCEPVCDAPRIDRWPTGKILWAARISEEKRPGVLKRIADRILEERIPVEIDVYGSATYAGTGTEIVEGVQGITYHGAFDGFASLPLSQYDALIYTTAYDGLPNVLLEALSAGMPVIAPDVGGISEVVNDQTGFLLDDCAEEDAIAEQYILAIKKVYADWDAAISRAEQGRLLVSQRHSVAPHRQRVREIFGLEG